MKLLKGMHCPECLSSDSIIKNGKTNKGTQRFKCLSCKKTLTASFKSLFKPDELNDTFVKLHEDNEIYLHFPDKYDELYAMFSSYEGEKIINNLLTNNEYENIDDLFTDFVYKAVKIIDSNRDKEPSGQSENDIQDILKSFTNQNSVKEKVNRPLKQLPENYTISCPLCGDIYDIAYIGFNDKGERTYRCICETVFTKNAKSVYPAVTIGRTFYQVTGEKTDGKIEVQLKKIFSYPLTQQSVDNVLWVSDTISRDYFEELFLKTLKSAIDKYKFEILGKEEVSPIILRGISKPPLRKRQMEELEAYR